MIRKSALGQNHKCAIMLNYKASATNETDAS